MRGTYTLNSPAAQSLSAACTAGQRLVLTAIPANSLYDGGQWVSSTGGNAAFANYLAALAGRFGLCLAAIEVGNEINGSGALVYPAGTNPAAAYGATPKGSMWSLLSSKPRWKRRAGACRSGRANSASTPATSRRRRAKGWNWWPARTDEDQGAGGDGGRRRAVRILTGASSICPRIEPSPSVCEIGESQILRTTSMPAVTLPNTA